MMSVSSLHHCIPFKVFIGTGIAIDTNTNVHKCAMILGSCAFWKNINILLISNITYLSVDVVQHQHLSSHKNINTQYY